MSKSPTTIDSSAVGDPVDWLHNSHAGEMLDLEFMQPLEISVADLARKVGVSESTIVDVVSGKTRIDAELDLRLARYFRMTAGFFLRLQLQFELLEAKRALNDALDRIVPRAA